MSGDNSTPRGAVQPHDPAAPDTDGLLTTSAEDLELPTPTLDEAKISADVAEEASLGEAVSEARAVEQEAEKAGTLVGGSAPSDTARSREDIGRKIAAAGAQTTDDTTEKKSTDE